MSAGIPLALRVKLHGLRLEASEVAALEHALAPLEAPVYLFGARLDAAGEGGDIALLVLSDAPQGELAEALARRFAERDTRPIEVVVLDPDRPDAEQQGWLATLERVRIH